MTATDFGDWSCDGFGCELDANTVSDNEINYTNVTLNDFTFDVGSVSKTEFGYLNGVTSAIQTQLNSKLENGDHWTLSGSDLYYTSGNVGIGTSSPNQRLTVADGNINLASSTAAFQIAGNDFARAAITRHQFAHVGGISALTRWHRRRRSDGFLRPHHVRVRLLETQQTLTRGRRLRALRQFAARYRRKLWPSSLDILRRYWCALA